MIVVKKRWLILLIGGLVLAVGIIWRAWQPASDLNRSVPELAIKAAAGDTNAIATLQALGPRAVPALKRLLSTRDNFFRSVAWVVAPHVPRWMRQHFLANIGPLQAAERRAAAAHVLGMLGPKADGAVPALLKTLNDHEAYVAMEAAAALSKIGPVSIPGLIMALEQKDQPVVRHAAAFGLGELGPPAEQAIPALIGRLGDTDPQVRASSAYSVTRIGYPAVAAMSNLIDHADASAREAAVQEFMRLYNSLRMIQPALVKMAHANESTSRRRAIEVLGALRLADNASVQTIMGALRDPTVEVRLAALKSLNLIPCRATAAASELTMALQDASPEVRAAAARLLGGIGPPAKPALNALRQCYRQEQGAVRAAAQEAIQKIAPGEPIELAPGSQ